MPLKPEVLDRFLLSKSFLDRIRFQPVALHDRHALASNIVAAHDAAELAIAGVCDQLGSLPKKTPAYLMDYLASLREARHPEKDVYGREYCRNLNATRNLVKHQGLFPDAKQWARVGEVTFQHVASWVSEYVNESFEELDESALLADAEVKHLYDEAVRRFMADDYKGALEQLALALLKVFKDNAALRGFEVGVAKSEDAIRLAGFGVHGNDFLALQEFLPRVKRSGPKANLPEWRQSKHGHPGNWTERSAAFCLRTFVDVAIKIQGAPWIPYALDRSVLYEQQIEVVSDQTEIWRYVQTSQPKALIATAFPAAEPKREVVRVLNRGDKIKAVVSLSDEASSSSLRLLLGGSSKSPDTIDVIIHGKKPIFGRMRLADVKVTCVPRQTEYVNKYFPDLPEIDWDPE